MSLLRSIKMHHINGDLDNLEEGEKLFFSLLNDADGYMDENGEVVYSGNYVIFSYSASEKTMVFDTYMVERLFVFKFGMKEDEISSIIKNVFKSKLNITLDEVYSLSFPPISNFK